MKTDYIREFNFCYRHSLREAFMQGTLGKEWAARYPEIFDERDLEIYHNQRKYEFAGQKPRVYHFFEWLAAVLIFESTGYRSFVEKYGCESHPKKCPIFERLISPEVCNLEGSGWPDLFCYLPDESDWFFCEVKGATDTLKKNQLITFPKLYKLTGKADVVLSLTEI